MHPCTVPPVVVIVRNHRLSGASVTFRCLAGTHLTVLHLLLARSAAALFDLQSALQADPQLLHLLLELDSRRTADPPAMRVSADASGGWVLGAPAAAAPEPDSKHKGSNGHSCDCSHPETHPVSSRTHADLAAATTAPSEAVPSHANSSASAPVNGDKEKSQQQTDSASHTEPSQAATAPMGQQPKQQKVADSSAGATGEPPTLQCTLEEVFLLIAHSENSKPAWQSSVGEAVEGLQKAMRDSRAFEPAEHSHYMVRAVAETLSMHER